MGASPRSFILFTHTHILLLVTLPIPLPRSLTPLFPSFTPHPQMTSFALFRLENELQDIHLLDNTSYKIINMYNILFTIYLSEGLYKGRTLEFIIDIPKDYPFTGPKIQIKNKIYHPNVDEEGRVCLEILREGWSCGFGLENIFINLFCILMEPSSENALNGEVREMMERDYEEFEKRAREVK